MLAQKRIMHAQAAQAQAAQAAQALQAPQELERLGSLKQQGLISEEEFQKLKMRMLSGV